MMMIGHPTLLTLPLLAVSPPSLPAPARVPVLTCGALGSEPTFREPIVTFVLAMSIGLITAASKTKVPALSLAQLGGSAALPTSVLLIIRTAFASTIAYSLYSSLTDRNPHVFTLMTYSGSRLTPCAVPVTGFERLTTFTVQCWTLQLLYFSLGTVASALQLSRSSFRVPVLFARCMHVLYEVSVATALLVTVTVTFVLLPERIKRADYEGARRMLGWRPQLMHNANLLFATTELLFNSLPIVPSHFVFGALFAVQYAFMSWWWLKRSGVVYYPFLDPTLPAGRAISLHTAVLVVLAAFFLLGAAVDGAAGFLPLGVRAPLLYAAACSLMWTSFIRGRPGQLASSEDDQSRSSE